MTDRASVPAAATISRMSPADHVRKVPVDAFLRGRFATISRKSLADKRAQGAGRRLPPRPIRQRGRVVEEGIGKGSMRAEAVSVMIFAGSLAKDCRSLFRTVPRGWPRLLRGTRMLFAALWRLPRDVPVC